MGFPVRIQIGESLCFPKEVDLRFKRTIGKDFSMNCKSSMNLAKSSIMPFILSTNSEDCG